MSTKRKNIKGFISFSTQLILAICHSEPKAKNLSILNDSFRCFTSFSMTELTTKAKFIN